MAELTDLIALHDHIQGLDSGSGEAKTLTWAIEEIEALRVVAATNRDQRTALASQVSRLSEAILWALGYTDFRPREEGEGAYWWRTELFKRSGLSAAALSKPLSNDPGPDSQLGTQMRDALMALYRDQEHIAVNSYMTRQGAVWVFNDTIWEDADPEGFEIMKTARDVLGLEPFVFDGEKEPGACVGREL